MVVSRFLFLFSSGLVCFWWGDYLEKKKSGGRIVIAPSRRQCVGWGGSFSEERPGLCAVLPYFWGGVLLFSVVAIVGIFSYLEASLCLLYGPTR